MKNQFQELQREWYRKLKEDGFKDIEDSKGNLKQHDIRTISYQNRDLVINFIDDLSHYLSQYPDIPELHQEILREYCNGIHLSKIAVKVDRRRETIWKIITIYKDKLRILK